VNEQRQRLHQSLEEQLFGRSPTYHREPQPRPRLVCFRRMHDDSIQMISSQDPVSINLIAASGTKTEGSSSSTSITLFNPIRDQWKTVVLPVKHENKLKQILELGEKPRNLQERAVAVFEPFTKFLGRYRESWMSKQDERAKSLKLLDRFGKAVFVDGVPLELGLRCARKLKAWCFGSN
jgi:hypothetical protein